MALLPLAPGELTAADVPPVGALVVWHTGHGKRLTAEVVHYCELAGKLLADLRTVSGAFFPCVDPRSLELAAHGPRLPHVHELHGRVDYVGGRAYRGPYLLRGSRVDTCWGAHGIRAPRSADLEARGK